MRLFWAALNTLWVAFALSAVVAFLDGLLHLVSGYNLLQLVRIPLEMVVVLGSPLAAIAMALSPRVPKTVFGPLVLVELWAVLGMMPLPIYLGLDALSIAIPAVHLAVALALLLRIRQLTGGRLLFPEDFVAEDAFFSWKNTAVVCTLTVLVGPPTLVAYAFLSADLACKVYSADFVRLGPSGLEIAHKRYTRGDQTLDLIGMSHIGDQAVYDVLFDDIPVNASTLLLEEGVSDREGHLGSGPLYEKMAKRAGLATQQPMRDMTTLEVRNADVDVSRFSPETLELLDLVLDIYRADDPLPPLLKYITFAQTHEDPEALGQQLHDDLITLRNDVLLEHVDRAFADYNRVVVPWGAYHMKGVEAEILSDGFVEVSDVRHTIVPFRLILGQD